jgi:hypothetical protein
MLKITKFCTILVMVLFSLDSYSQVDGVGINTTNPNSTLDVNGNLSVKVLTLNGGPGGSATPINDGVYLSLNPTFGNREFILPNAASVRGRIYILRNISGSETAQIYSFGGDFYSKDASGITTAPLNMPVNALLKTVIIVSDGANWTYFF